MAEEREEIVYSIDTREAETNVKGLNREIEKTEDASVKASEGASKAFGAVGKAASAQGETVVRVMSKTQNATDRYLASLEKRLAGMKAGSLGSILAERDTAINKRLAGDSQAIDRAKKIFGEMIETQKKFDFDSGAKKAADASRRAARGTEEFQKALSAVNKEAKDKAIEEYTASLKRAQDASKQQARAAEEFQRALSNQNRTIRAEAARQEREGALAGLSGSARLQAEKGFAVQSVGADAISRQRIGAGFDARIAAAQQKEFTDTLSQVRRAAQLTDTQIAGLVQQFDHLNAAARNKSLLEYANSLGAAQRASQQAARGSAEFDAALQRRNKQVRDSVAAFEARAAAASTDKTGRLLLEEQRALKAYGNSAENIDRIRAAFAKLRAEQESQNKPVNFTRQIVEGGILLGVLERLAGTVKDATVGSVIYASKTDQLATALHTVAKANTITVGSAVTLEEQIKKSGVTTQDASENLARLIAAHVDYRKAVELAKVAQDVGRVSGEGTAKSYERLTHAIISAQPELLRQVGLNLSFEESYKRAAHALGRTTESLTEAEKMQIRLNDTLTTGASYAGVYQASLDKVGGRYLSLARKADEARNAIGQRFQTEAGATLSFLEKIADLIEKHPGAAVQASAFGLILGGGLVAGLAAATASPIIGGLGILAGAIGAVVLQVELLGKAWRNNDINQTGLMNFIEAVQTSRDSSALTAGLRTDLLTTARGKFEEANNRQRKEAEANATAQKNALAAQEAKAKEKAAKEIEAAEKHVHQLLMETQASEYSGLHKIIGERAKLIEQYGVSAKAIGEINKVTKINLDKELRNIAQERRKWSEEQVKTMEDAEQRQSEVRNKRYQEELKFQEETIQLQQTAAQRALDFETTMLERRRDSQLRNVDAREATLTNDKRNLPVRDGLIRERLQIELDFERAAFESRKAAVDRDAAAQIAADTTIARTRLDIELATIRSMEEANVAYTERKMRREAGFGPLTAQRQAALDAQVAAMRATSESRVAADEERIRTSAAQAIADRESAINEAAAQKKFEIQNDYETNTARLRDEATVKSTELYVSAHREAFDRTRQAFSSLLDQMFSRTKSFGDVMKSILKAALLTPLKEAAATAFASAVTGQPQTSGSGRARGGILPGIFGGLFSGGLGAGSAGGGGFGGFSGFGPTIFGSGSITGGPGGTGGFAGPVRSIAGLGGPAAVAGAGGGRGAGGLLGFGGFAAQGKGLLGALRGLGNIGFGPKGGDFGGEVAGSFRGVGGLGGAAMLAGGFALGADGLRRGGLVGLGELTGAGALIGGKFGGPIGAAIGAGVGAIVGTVRLFFKGAEAKAIEKVQQRYNVRINKDLAGQLIGMAKQSYAGNLDMAITSGPGRDLIELYAMSTGQKWGFAPTAPQLVSLEQRGGSLFQAPTYRNGAPLPSLGGTIPSLGVASPGPTVVYVQAQFDRAGTRDVLQGEIVNVAETQPKVFAQANYNATQQSSNRREMAALTTAPGLVTS